MSGVSAGRANEFGDLAILHGYYFSNKIVKILILVGPAIAAIIAED